MRTWREPTAPNGLWGYQEIGKVVMIWHNYFHGNRLIIEGWRYCDDKFSISYKREVRK